MTNELLTQEKYWDSEVKDFDSIYSHGKSRFSNWLDKTFRWDMYARYEFTLKNSEPIKDKSFLDVGCGTGRYSIEFAKRGAGKVVGLDISNEMIKVCEDRSKKEGFENFCIFYQTDLIQYRNDSLFDVCIGVGLFDYISNPLPVISKMHKVVSGCAIMTFPRSGTWRAYLRKIRLGLKGCPVYFYSKTKIEKLLADAGFKSHDIEIVGQLYCVKANRVN
ncbi:MAG: class I SAM-dependent methyltransferase [Ignavibacteriaceae bacterium]